MEPFEAIWWYLDIFFHFLLFLLFLLLKPFGAIWGHLEPFRAVSSHLESFEAIWCLLEPFGAIWSQIIAFKYISFSLPAIPFKVPYFSGIIYNILATSPIFLKYFRHCPFSLPSRPNTGTCIPRYFSFSFPASHLAGLIVLPPVFSQCL